MKFTERFNKALIITGVVTLLLILWQTYLSVNGLSGISISHPEENTPFRIGINFVKNLFSTTAIWLTLGYLFNNYKAIAYGLILSITTSTYHYFYPSASENASILSFGFYIVLNFSKYAVFGYLIFKHPKGLWMMLIPLFTSGIISALDPHVYERFLNGFLRIVGMRDFFELRISTGERSYRPVSMIRILSMQLGWMIQIFMVWALYLNLSIRNKIDFKFFDMYLHNDHKWWRYSIIYWVLRLSLAISAFGIVSFIGRNVNDPFQVKTIFWLICFCLGFYVLASIYRNFMTSKFLSREKIPGFLYFLLNIPIVNFFAWIFSLFYFGTHVEVQKNDEFMDRLSNKFSLSNRNGGLKILLIVILGATIFFQYTNLHFNSFSGMSGMEGTMIGVMGLINVAVLCWFLYDKNAYFILVVLSCIGFFSLLFLGQKELISLAKGGALLSLIYYFGMFYWDKLNLLTEGENGDIQLEVPQPHDWRRGSE